MIASTTANSVHYNTTSNFKHDASRIDRNQSGGKTNVLIECLTRVANNSSREVGGDVDALRDAADAAGRYDISYTTAAQVTTQ